jgi:uncharacterized membrane protein YphA (DoxX/SURF4 family)
VIKKVLLHPLVVWGCRLIVAAVLIFAAVQKIWMPLEFARLIKEYHLLPDQVLNLVAVILPWLEIVCGLCFLSGLWLMGTAALLSSLNIIFVIAIAYRAWLIMSSTGVGFFDLSYDCGCGFGVVYIPTKILENLLLVGVGLIILFAQRKVNVKDTR